MSVGQSVAVESYLPYYWAHKPKIAKVTVSKSTVHNELIAIHFQKC